MTHWEAARDAFGLRGDPLPIEGGVTGVLRFGDTVVKTVTDLAEAEWTQATFARLAPVRDISWARPRATTDGRWVADGWVANEFVPGLVPVAPDWPRVIRFGNLLHHATAAIEPPVAILAARQHRWAVGERYAFDEEPGLELPAQVADIDRHLAGWCTPDPDRRQVVHVDLAGNVFLGPDGTPVVLDISPGCRSPGYADAVVVADALLWSGAGPELLEALGDRVRAHARVARGLRFRLATEQVAAMRGQRSVHDADPAPYRRVIEALS